MKPGRQAFLWKLCLFFWLCVPPVHAETVINQVSYKAVLEHPFRAADSRISYGKSELQVIEAWSPKSADNPIDIIFIHGGCWLSAYDIAHSRAFTTALSDAGYRVWSLEYRRTGDEDGGWPESFNDILQAINYLQDEQALNPEEAIIIGHSAGGHLALLAAQKATKFKAVVGLAAIVDIEAYANGDNSCQSATAMFMGDTPQDAPRLYHEANPKSQPMPENTYLIYSQKDSIVPVNQTKDLLGGQLVELQEAGHFDFIYPQSAAFQMILATLTAIKE